MSTGFDPRHDTALDRLRELTNIGAGHAAGALAELLGVPVRMHVPRLWTRRAAGASDGETGVAVCFDVHGEPGGRLVVLFPESGIDALLETWVGAPEPERIGQVESALEELGNILASHALSAVADTVGQMVLPSVPRLVNDAARESAGRLPGEPGAPVRIENELVDADGRLRGVLVWIPDALRFG